MKTLLGRLLLRDEFVSEAQLARALEVQNFAGGRIGTLLMERGALGEDNLGRTLALQHGCPYVPWMALGDLRSETIAALPARFALKHCAIPYERGESYVRMVLRDPGDLRILDELVFVTGKKVHVAVAPEVRIYQALEKYYGKLRAPRYAILAERLSRPEKHAPSVVKTPPPPPVFFNGPARPAGIAQPTETDSPSTASGEVSPLSPAVKPAAPAAPRSMEGSAGWASYVSPAPEPATSEPEGIAWEDTTGTRAKARLEPPPVSPPAPFEEVSAFDFVAFDPFRENLPDMPPESPVEHGFNQILSATERDAIAEAVLDALVRRFETAAIFSSRSDGVFGWAAAGTRVDRSAVRAFAATWTEPSVFLNTRLSRAPYAGPLPPLPRHEQLVAALGGWPAECVVQPVLIGEKPVAFLFAAGGAPRSETQEDLVYVQELADAAATAFANAIRLKKKEI